MVLLTLVGMSILAVSLSRLIPEETRSTWTDEGALAFDQIIENDR